MRINRKIVVFVIAMYSANTLADMTGAGDTAILQQLIVQVQKMNEQYKAMKEQIGLAEKMENYEKLKNAKKTSEEGNSFLEFVNETNEFMGDVKEFVDNVDEIQGVSKEMNAIAKKLDKAKEADDKNKLKAYSSIMVNLKRIHKLAKANEKTKQKMSTGVNESDKSHITAANTTIMADILIANEERAKKREINNVDSMETIFDNTNYSALAE